MACVGQLVSDEDGLAVLHEPPHKTGPDEPRATRNKPLHLLSLLKRGHSGSIPAQLVAHTLQVLTIVTLGDRSRQV